MTGAQRKVHAAVWALLGPALLIVLIILVVRRPPAGIVSPAAAGARP